MRQLLGPMRALPYLRVARRTAALGLLVAGCGGGEGPPPPDPLDPPDVLDLRGTPDSARDASVSAFADLGAWHMFALPDPGAGDDLGGFPGPLLLTDGGVWLGRSLAGFRVWADDGDQPLVWEPAGDAAVASYPGRLVQHVRAGALDATVELVFVSERSALVRATLTHGGAAPVTLALGWAGDAGLVPARVLPQAAGVRVELEGSSGMDNAVRFDSATMVKNHDGAWSLDQESVDLNAYLFAEKGYLATLAEVVGRADQADAYRRDAQALGQKIRTAMWDEETGYFYDLGMEGGGLVRVQGPEGWIPLWAGAATPEQAARVARVMMDPTRFAAPVPLPTLAMDRPEFDPTDGYWRGPVWLDQAYFGVRGLERYGLRAEGAELRARLLAGPVGLTGDAPIFENYDPRTGEGLNAPHFSWSAAHLLMLLYAGDGLRP